MILFSSALEKESSPVAECRKKPGRGVRVGRKASRLTPSSFIFAKRLHLLFLLFLFPPTRIPWRIWKKEANSATGPSLESLIPCHVPYHVLLLNQFRLPFHSPPVSGAHFSSTLVMCRRFRILFFYSVPSVNWRNFANVTFEGTVTYGGK